MKKIALALGVAATLGAASAHAGYTTSFAGLNGRFVIDQFGVDQPGASLTLPDADQRFRISLTNLNGAVSIQVPTAGTYSAQAMPGFAGGIDYNGVPGFDLGVTYPQGAGLGTGYISVTNTSTRLINMNFNGVNATTLLLDGVAQTLDYTGHLTLSGFGATTFFASLFGLNNFLTGPVSGSVDVAYTVRQDALEVFIDETNLVGTKFENIFLALDNGVIPGAPADPLKNARIDGVFAVNGSINVPEPGSLALLGLGLATCLTLRRRKAA